MSNNGCGIKRILRFSMAIQYQPIKLYDELNNDITETCEYSWSSDGVCWTNWSNYSTYDRICKNIETDYFLRVHLFGSLGKVYLNGSLTNCYNICIDASNPFLQDFCGTPNLFQPYDNLDCALQLQQQMADSVICMFGIPIYYLRVQPDEQSADYTFKEYSLHNVVDIKQIKLMVPDGTMPSSNPKLGEFDFDWESDWEVELGKTQFAKAFGDTIIPKQRDLVYVPMMKRLWEVNSAYDEKNEGLLWRSTTWKLAMVKYNEKTNVDNNEYESIIDGWLTNKYEETFGELERNEQERLVGAQPISAPVTATNNLYSIFTEDAVRKAYTKDLIINIDRSVYHGNSIVARNFYGFAVDTEVDGNDIEGRIVYQKGICGDSGSIALIINCPAINGTLENKPIINFGPIHVDIKCDNNKYIITWGSLSKQLDPAKSKDENKIYMILLRWNIKTYSVEMDIYNYVCRDDVPEYLIKPNMYSFDYKNPVCELIGTYNNDFDIKTPHECSVTGYPIQMSNIKYYNKYLDKNELIKETTKYTTQHESCVINDLVRPITAGHGYVVK